VRLAVTAPGTLSIHRSFVVRLYPGFDLDGGGFAGCFEYLVSGEVREFRSVDEFLV
jgi:hypothetical protein